MNEKGVYYQCQWIGNQASQDGGAVDLLNEVFLITTPSVFRDNKADKGNKSIYPPISELAL
jgi:hypothetical protein